MHFSRGIEGAVAYDRWFDAGWGAYAFRSESKALLRSAGRVEGLRALDVGCGTGRMTEILGNGGASVVGIDSDAAMLAVAALRTSAPLILGDDMGTRHGVASVSGVLFAPENLPGLRLIGPLLESIGSLAPGAGAFQVLTVTLPQ